MKPFYGTVLLVHHELNPIPQRTACASLDDWMTRNVGSSHVVKQICWDLCHAWIA